MTDIKSIKFESIEFWGGLDTCTYVRVLKYKYNLSNDQMEEHFSDNNG